MQMAKDVRDKMVAGAMRLLATHGVQRTSIHNVTEATKTPRGSVYHFFPRGKEQMIEEALGRSCRGLLIRLRDAPLPDAPAVTRAFVDVWRWVLTTTNFEAGCAVVGVAVTSENDEQRRIAFEIFSTWRAQLTELLVGVGVESQSASDFAYLLVSACEGAVVVCRTSLDFTPLDKVERQLLTMAAALPKAESQTSSDMSFAAS